MILPRKKILILYCTDATKEESLDFSKWLKGMSELEIIAAIDDLFVGGEHSCFSPNFWQTIAQKIVTAQKNYDGFVIIHPIDTLLYTASALSFLLHDFKKPIVFTGVQIPITDSAHLTEKYDELDIKANLINSVQVATFDFAEVAVMSGNKLIRANATFRPKDTYLNAFTGPENAILGKIDFSFRTFEKNFKKISVVSRFKMQLNDNIEYLKIQPIFDAKELMNRLQKKDGLVVEGQGYPLPKDLELLISTLMKDLPVVLFNLGNQAEEDNMISINNMTIEATLVKFMYILAQSKNLKEIKKLMQANIAGEIQ